jgi:hypothetical protein
VGPRAILGEDKNSREVGPEINAEKTKVYDYVSSSVLRTEPEYKDS